MRMAKQEEVYSKSYETFAVARESHGTTERLHKSHGCPTPRKVYFEERRERNEEAKPTQEPFIICNPVFTMGNGD